MKEANIINSIEQAASGGMNAASSGQSEPQLQPGEKAERAWGLFREYSKLRRHIYRNLLRENKGKKVKDLTPEEKSKARHAIQKDPAVQWHEQEIAGLWREESVKKLVSGKVAESVSEAEPHQTDLELYRQKQRELSKLKTEYFDLLRNQFVTREKAPMQRRIIMARNRAAREKLAADIKLMEAPKGKVTKDQADLAALIANERIGNYHDQFKKTGFINVPSREPILEHLITETARGTWCLLVGETGTGKTTFAKNVSWILNGEPPQYASGEEQGDTSSLIGKQWMDPKVGQVYYQFGPLTTALTGCIDSLQMKEVIEKDQKTKGKLLILDELNQFNQPALFGSLKVADTLSPGEEFNYKEMAGVKLKKTKIGSAIIATMNPASARYERKELDPALDRLFKPGEIQLPYPEMTDEKPELFEMFLGILRDNNGRTRIPPKELGPSFLPVEDTAAGTITEKIDPDPTKHGNLYRFSKAVGEIHKNYSLQENDPNIGQDLGNLEKATLEMKILVKWMKDYADEIEGGKSLTSYLEHQLNGFYKNINTTDRAIFKRIFDYFGFPIEQPSNTPRQQYEPLTPMEFGYLTPSTPRAVIRKGKEAKPETKIYIDPDSGKEILYLPETIETVKDDGETFLLEPNTVYKVGEEHELYLGIDPDSGVSISFPITKK